MRKDFMAVRMCFHVGNMHILNWDVNLEEVDSFDQHATPLCFDDIT